MGQRYAVLISGDLAETGFYEFFFDIVLVRQALLDNGFADNDIFVLYGNGTDYSSASHPATKYQPSPAITDMSANIADVQSIFSDLANGTNGRPQLTDQDLLFVYTFDHGSRQWDAGLSAHVATLGLMDGSMRADDFATAVNQVPHGYRVFAMQQCYSGGFVPWLDSDRTVILTACSDSEVAHPADGDGPESEVIGGVTYPHGEFNVYLVGALTGQTPNGTTANADANSDGFVVMREVFDYIAANEDRTETPQYADGTLDLGDRLHLSFADLCLRDNLSDQGVEPSVGASLCMSPDIHHYRNQLSNPAATLLAPGALNDTTLFEDVEKGQDNWIYVRARNRGYSASDAVVDVYWAPPSTLITPASWSLIGSTSIGSTTPDGWGVSAPLKWPGADIPATGHYCFLALLRNAQDPTPDLASITSWSTFMAAVRNSNNMAWKNFDVVDVFADSFATIPFLVQGWPRMRLLSDIEVDLRKLPRHVRAELQFRPRTERELLLEGVVDRTLTRRRDRFFLESGRVSAVRRLYLRPSDKMRAQLVVHIPANTPEGEYDLNIRQLESKPVVNHLRPAELVVDEGILHPGLAVHRPSATTVTHAMIMEHALLRRFRLETGRITRRLRVRRRA